MRRRRGFVQFAILHLLKEESMHGYQIMKELEERSNGTYSASAGTVYPALQELMEQQLIELDTSSDKKVYSINENGVKHLQNKHLEGDFWVEWKERMMWRNSEQSIQLRGAVDRWEKEFRKAMKHARGNPESVHELIAFIDDMTESLSKKSTKQGDRS
ncbi:DNA-binding PadR family transcriptional regulator [Cytobacillus eiseniae]|uniref:DNA-binding PadR family transcriptional regulator n=1 Tax=Cytobacillus eiseniae TaxID=762947 RepID=A0ABS4RBT9_9BACI|nr:PadR family transcriptional regulator [Cytobacillus eiseniae]MBP2240367.1 DNA-binding PadR family transcriptional regulator [Cytobacillus eiseniae]